MAGLRGARVVVVGAGEMGLGVCRALSDIAPADAPRSVSSWSTARAARAQRPGARRRGRAVRDAGGAARARAPAELADADVVLSAVAAESHVLRGGGLRRRRPAPCS